METRFSFKSTAFNCTDSKDQFINPGCFGDDLARWMIDELRTRGVKTAREPGQEDYGWYFTFVVADIEHCVVLGFQPNDASIGDQWIGWVERQAGFVSSLIGGRKRGISPEAIDLIDKILTTAPQIKDLRWGEYV